jgi:uncharacterized membrane protein YkoI
MNKATLAIFLSISIISFFDIKTSQAHGIGPAGHMNMKKAKQIALEQVMGEIVDSRIENDGGKIKYEFVIQSKDGWHVVEIEKATGKVLEVNTEGIK